MHSTFTRLALTVAASAALSACQGHRSSSVLDLFAIDNGNVILHADHASDAILTPSGGLSIGGNAVGTDPTQQALLKRLHDDVLALRGDAVAVGKAGAATGAQAISSVVSGLASGNPDKIDQDVNAKAAVVEAHVAQLCTNLAAIRATEQTLAAQLPSFRPYANVDAASVANCKAS